MQSPPKKDDSVTAHIVEGLNSMEEAFVIYDKDGFLVECNKAFRDLYNYTEEQAHRGVHFRQLGVIDIENGNVAIGTTNGEDYLAKKAEYRKALKGSFDVLLKDGRWIRTTDRALPRGGFVSVQIDITSQKRAEKTLQENEVRMSKLLEATPVIIFAVDILDNFRNTYVSQNIEEIFGYSAQTFLSDPDFWPSRLHPDEAEAVQANARKQIHSADSYMHEYRFRRPDGTYCWVLDNVTVVRDREGTPVELVGTWQDISERKEMEEALRIASEEAQAANKSKSAFLANMSHEIRTPMNGVLAMAEVLGRTDLNEDQVRMVSTILNSGNSLLRIIDDVLDYSKIEAGKLDLDYEEMDLRDTLEGAAVMMAPTADENNVRLHLRLEPDVPRRISFDIVRLRQILNNLLSNAVKFSKKPLGEPYGQVQLSARKLDGNLLQFQVSDDGVGMSEEAVANLFKPFEQAEVSTNRRFGGTGLGLSIVKDLSELMGGDITVDSKINEGSIFTVTLPFTPLNRDRTQTDEEKVPAFGLFDEELNLNVVKANTRKNSVARMTIAKDERELLDLLQDAKEPIIINLALGSMAANNAVQERVLAKFPQAKFMSQTSDRSDKIGLISPNCYVISRFPTLPSEVENATRVLSGKSGKPETTIEPARHKAVAPHNARILLVEDNETNQTVITAQLRMLGYSASIANDGQEGLELWKSGDFSLVLTDCHMPEMDGFEMTGRMRTFEAENDLKRSPIIAITANALQGESDRCLEAGMDDYLSKPVTLANLEKALSFWLGN